MNSTGSISTQYRLPIKTTKMLKSLIETISDIEGVSVSDAVHDLYREKLLSLQRDQIELPDEATVEVEKHFNLIMRIG